MELCRGLITAAIRWCLGAVPAAMWLLLTSAGSSPAASAAVESPVRIEILDTESHVIAAPDQNSALMRLGLSIRVTNDSEESLRLQLTQFTLSRAGQVSEALSYPSPEPLKAVVLQPRTDVTGWVWYTLAEVPRGPPGMTLQWQRDDAEVQVSVDEHLRLASACEIVTLGPQKCLTVLRCRRRLDALSVWLLSESMQECAARGARRLVISIDRSATNRLVTDDVFQWLLQADEHADAAQLRVVPFPECPVRFLEIHLAGVQRAATRSGGRREGPALFATETLAVAAALDNVYRFLDVAQGLSDLGSDHPGVCEAALSGIIDRVALNQLRAIVDASGPGNLSQLRLLAAMLDRVPDPEVAQLAGELVLHPDRRVSDAAIRSLTRFAGADAVRVLCRLRDEHPAMQNRIAAAALESSDDRWTTLITDHTITLLRKLAGPEPDPNPEVAPPPPEIPVDPNAGTTYRRQNPLAGPPPEALDADIGVSSLIGPATLRQLLEGTDPLRIDELVSVGADVLNDLPMGNMQDDVAMFLAQHDRGTLTATLQNYIDRQLHGGPMSTTVGNLIHLYPDPRWTEELLSLAMQNESPRAGRPPAVQHALSCASSSQLQLFVDRFDQMDAVSRGVTLSHLASVGYPDWRTLADRVLSQEGADFNQGLDALHLNASEESIAILVRHLQDRLDRLNKESDSQGSVVDHCRRLVIKLALISHPEARRMLNRALGSGHPQIREQATNSLAGVARRSPAYTMLRGIPPLLREGMLDQAIRLADAALAADELFPDAWVARAQLRLRQGDMHAALQDLEAADRLSPESSEVHAVRAVTRIRQGAVDEGLQLIQELLQQAPHDAELKFAAACCYSRAAEVAGTNDDRRPEYVARAQELLKETISNRQIAFDRLLSDPDLQPLRDEPGWRAFMLDVSRTLPEELLPDFRE